MPSYIAPPKYHCSTINRNIRLWLRNIHLTPFERVVLYTQTLQPGTLYAAFKYTNAQSHPQQSLGRKWLNTLQVYIISSLPSHSNNRTHQCQVLFLYLSIWLLVALSLLVITHLYTAIRLTQKHTILPIKNYALAKLHTPSWEDTVIIPLTSLQCNSCFDATNSRPCL